MPGIGDARELVLPWQDAWQQALYGPTGFYRRAEGPAAHFRTSSHVPLFAQAVARLAADLDEALGSPPGFTVVDVGTGRGELLTGLADLAPDRWRLVGVDLVDRPPGLDPRIEWSHEVPRALTGLLMAHELLDVVPCPVVEVDLDGQLRYVRVDVATGVETPGDALRGPDAAWLQSWWPLSEPGERAEVGRPRDEAWRALVGRVSQGGALAVDYAHSADDRGAGRWARGSLVGHRRGRVVPPVADGSCDLTARVALDATAAAAADLVDLTFLTSQREALRVLGVDDALPDPQQASAAPEAYAAGLRRAGEARELMDQHGLGGFGWLLQVRGVSPGAPAPG